MNPSRFSRAIVAVLLLAVFAPFAQADIFVSSTGNNLVQDYNNTTGAFVANFTGGTLTAPSGIVYGPNGEFFVGSGTSSSNAQVLEYKNNGTFDKTFIAINGGGLTTPTGLAFGGPSKNLYVADANNNVANQGDIRMYSGSTGAFISDFGVGFAALSKPAGLVFGPNGNVFVSNNGNNRVLEFNPDGTSPATFTSGTQPTAPTGLVFGPDGNLYVSSSGTNQVLEYDGSTGAFITAFASGNGLTSPYGLAFDLNGNLFVSSSTNQVFEFSSTGSFVRSFGTNLSNPTFLTSADVPEPSSLLLGGIAALGGLGGCIWRRRRKSELPTPQPA